MTLSSSSLLIFPRPSFTLVCNYWSFMVVLFDNQLKPHSSACFIMWQMLNIWMPAILLYWQWQYGSGVVVIQPDQYWTSMTSSTITLCTTALQETFDVSDARFRFDRYQFVIFWVIFGASTLHFTQKTSPSAQRSTQPNIQQPCLQ